MKKLMTAALALSLALMSTAAFAQPEPGDIGVFADAAGTQSTLTVDAFALFNFYVVAFDVEGQPNAFEYGLDFGVAAADFSITLEGLAGPNPGNIGSGPTNVIAFTGACLSGDGALVLASYSSRIFVSPIPNDIAITVGPSSPSSFDPPAPGWSWCDGVTKSTFGVAQNGEASGYPNASLIINPLNDSPVATEATSFSEVKARF